MSWDYKCGHSSTMIILGNESLAFVEYCIWKEEQLDTGLQELCFKCWIEKKRKEESEG